MTNALLSSKTIVQEEEPRIQTIEEVQTSVVAAVGITERGPVGVATLIKSPDEYRSIFGGYTADGDVALAVDGFFDNGGQFIYIVRTVHYTDPSSAATKTSAAGTLELDNASGSPTSGSVTGTEVETFDFEPGEQISVDVDGGGAAAATFDATAATRTAGSTGTYALSDGQTLTAAIDGGSVQTVTFNTAEFSDIGAATAEEVAAVMNAELTGCSVDVDGNAPRITSDKRGTDSGVNVTGGTANTALNFTTGNVAGTGDVADIDAVTVAEIKTVMEADIAGLTINDVSGAVQIVSDTTGASSSIQVAAGNIATAIGVDSATHSGTSGAATGTLTIDAKYDGAYADDVTVTIEDATDGESDHFNLIVLEDGLVAETFPNLSMIDVDARYAETVINATDGSGSDLIQVTDLDTTGNQRPANGTFGPLSGGDDGISGIVDADYVGNATGGTGIRALDAIQDVNILTVPAQGTSAVHNAMITYCDVTRAGSMFAILDCPAGQTAAQMVTYVDTTASLTELSEFGAIYWPRVKVLNPAVGVFGSVSQLTVAPSGIIAGIYARTDGSGQGGIYKSPAGQRRGILSGVLGFETDEVLKEEARDLLYPKRINPLTTAAGAPRFIDGGRTLKSTGDFPHIAQRRGAIFIEQSIKTSTDVTRHDNITEELRRELSRATRRFLKIQMSNGAFASQDPEKAFFVDFGDKLNPASQAKLGRTLGRIGLAFSTPNEFLILSFSADNRALEQELAEAA